MSDIATWLELLGKPLNYDFEKVASLAETFSTADFDAELYRQNNGPSTTQRLLLVLPKTLKAKNPGVVIPFYSPDSMLGFDLETRKDIVREGAQTIQFARQLVRRGYIVALSETYHLTWLPEDKSDRNDFSRWKRAGTSLLQQHPTWTGIGKLIADTNLMTDFLCQDPRVDSANIGMIGHSLGGKITFYASCLDPRIKAFVASDFGFIWEQTNWKDCWYWGEKLPAHLSHTELLALAVPRAFMLIAGEADDERSGACLDQVRPLYVAHNASNNLRFLNHASGHRPPQEASMAAYDFLDEFLKQYP